jgi:hypothetical protein
MLEAEGIDLLKRMLDYDPAKRISVSMLRAAVKDGLFQLAAASTL